MDSAQYDGTVLGSARRTGGRHGYVAFFPARLPRQVPISSENLILIADAEAALGRLAGAGVRGRDREPGDLRTTQNWIGSGDATVESATFVPPPPGEIAGLLSDLEYFVHEDPQLPPLVQGALVHYQFETIHPFLDGNGRIGRLLIVFFLVVRDRLPSPLLYLSPFFEARRQAYYDALQGVRQRGDLDTWLRLFLLGVHTQANDALARAERLSDLRERYRRSVQAKTRGGANRLVDLVFEQPVVNARTVERRLGLSRPSALNALRQLEDPGVLAAAREGPRGHQRGPRRSCNS